MKEKIYSVIIKYRVEWRAGWTIIKFMHVSLSLTTFLWETNFYLHRFTCITSGGEWVSRAHEVLLIVFKRQKGEENKMKNGFITTTQTTKKERDNFRLSQAKRIKVEIFKVNLCKFFNESEIIWIWIRSKISQFEEIIESVRYVQPPVSII